ncbi:hypothetical protein P171DRAFT_479670, partial [Karstenula rhodostoma CBS 690.94]
MVSSRSASTMHMVASILLISNVAYASVLPPNQPYLPGTIAARAPSEDVTNTQDLAEMIDTLSAKKEGKKFFKELGQFLSDFDAIDVFRTMLGGLLGFNVTDRTVSSWLATTVSITPTPIESPLPVVVPTSKTTSTEKVTTKQVKTSSTKASSSKKSSSSKKASSSTSAEAVFSILPIFPTEEPLELTGLAPTALATPNHIIFTPGAAVSFRAAVSADAEVSVDVLPTGPFIDIFDVSSIEVPEETKALVALSEQVNATAAPNATAFGITVIIEPDETASILPFIDPEETAYILPFLEPEEDLSDDATFSDVPSPTYDISITGTFGLPTAQLTLVAEATELFEPEDTFSILPFFSLGEGISDNVLPATAEEIPPLETFEVVTIPVTDVPGATLLPVQTEEIFSILPFLEPGENISDN